MMKLTKDFKDFTRKIDEDNKDYVARFSKLETQLKNEKIKLPNSFLTGILLKESKFDQIKKENLMATINMEDEDNILKEMKKKIRDFRAIENCAATEPKETLFGGRRGSFYNRSRSFSGNSRSGERNSRF